MDCDCAGVLFGDGQHDAGCPALVAEPVVGIQESEAAHAAVSDALTKEQLVHALERLLHYKTTLDWCGCADFKYRRQPKLTHCKHIRLFRTLEPYLEEIKIMPIRGLTHDRQRMLPRIGKIRLGIKKKHSNGNEYPAKTDYFVCPPEVREVYGEFPKELTIVLPTMDLDVIAPTWYKAYQQTRDWVCKGDGERANRKMNPERVDRMGNGVWGPLPHRDDRSIQLYPNVVCRGRECPDYHSDSNPRGACSEVMNLQFLMPDVDGYGVWQIDTGSFHSITGFYDSVAYLNLFGNFAGVPLTLALEPKDVTPFGKKITVYVLKLKMQGKLDNLLEAAKSPMWALGEGVVPEPDEERDEMLHAGEYAPEGVVPLPDDDDYSNAANFRRAQAGVPQRQADDDFGNADFETGEIPQEPDQKGATFRDRINACESAADYTALLNDVYDRLDEGEQKVRLLDRISDAAEEGGYVVDKPKLLISDPRVKEVEPEPEKPPTEGEAVAQAEDTATNAVEEPETSNSPSAAPDQKSDGAEASEGPKQAVRVECEGCGEEVDSTQVNEDGLCSLCTMPVPGNNPATSEDPATEPEPAGAALL